MSEDVGLVLRQSNHESWLHASPWMLALGLGCATQPTQDTGSDASTDPCTAATTGHGAPGTEGELVSLFARVQSGVHSPSLDEVQVDMVAMTSATDGFTTGPDLTTLDRPGPERRYIVRFNTLVFETPPPAGGTAAILAHELQHAVDYTEMDGDELLDFALRYAEGDIAAYERETDEVVLEAGCASGLKAYREWLYQQVDAETEANKRRDYYTPDEIDAWVADQGD